MIRLLAFLAGCSCILPSVSYAQPINTDSTLPAPNTFWNSKAVRITAVPLGLFAASAATWGERQEIRKFRNRYIPTFRHHYDDYLQYVPVLTVFGLNAAGVKGKHTVKRTFVTYAISAGIMAAVVNGIKYTAKVERPSGDERNSFPSGHTANSFMNATLLHKEYGQYRHPLYSVGAYALGTATALGRQLNNRHWISDVLAGAGIGILSTELGYIIAEKIYKDKGEHPPLHNNPIPINKKPSFLELRLGGATATSRDLTGRAAQIRARQGFNMGLEGAWFFHRNIGIGGEFAFSSFPIKSDSLVLKEEIEDIADGHYTQPMGIRYLNIGPFFSIPLPYNWFITARITAGTSVGAQGNVLLELNEDAKEIFDDQPELPFLRYKPETAFNWNAGAGIQKRIGRNVAIKAYASYFHSRHDFTLDILSDIDENTGNYVYESYGSEKVKFDHITFGLALTAFIW